MGRLGLLLAGAIILSWSAAVSGDRLPITPLTNEVSFFKNVDDAGLDRGTTLQVIAINEISLGTNFIFEFTGDFNWGLDFVESRDYYLELSVVKPVYKRLSLNYQRIYGTFCPEPVNQFGLRLSLFSGS